MREIVTTPRFDRRLVSFTKRHPEFKEVIRELMRDIARGTCKKHALHGVMKGSYSARVSQSYRLVFALEPDAVIFIDMGSHDEVY
ncbi:MAG: type II toxin-antitoxin system RelE/ParE family toxin [Minisyncoccota bacterium]